MVEMREDAAVRATEAAREARSRAAVLEMIGDLPDTEIRSSDNLLFVCKLNAVAEVDDLEIIFSRFGKCRADIIRDPKKGQSLNYSFIEFESAEQCTRT